MLSHALLEHWKGLQRRYDLHGPTLLLGPNGSGKSALLEAIRYALTGSSPAGKNADAVAQFFAPRGGSVTVTDDAGHWIRRGITRDHAKAKTSEVLMTSDDPPEGPPDLTRWQATAELLDLGAFLALTPPKRRDFVLRLCGSGLQPPDLLGEIATAYAREIAGPGATRETLESPDDLPEDIGYLASAWGDPRGVREFTESLLVDQIGEPLSATLLGAAKGAREERLHARRGALDAQSAARELAAGAEEQRALASTLPAREREYSSAQERHREAYAELRRAQELELQVARRLEALAGAVAQRDKLRQDLVELPEPGERPPDPEYTDEYRAAYNAHTTAINRRQEVREALQAAMASRKETDRRRDYLRQAMRNLTDTLRHHREEPHGKLLELLGEVPDTAHPRIPELRELAGRLAGRWQETLASIDGELRKTLAELEELEEARKAELGKSLPDIMQAEQELERAAEAQEAASRDVHRQTQALAAWKDSHACYTTAERLLEQASGAVNKANDELAELRGRLNSPLDELRDRELRTKGELLHAKQAVEQAQEAAGALRALELAEVRAASERLRERAFGALEKALQGLRQRLAGSATKNLLADLNAALERAGRPERAFLELETPRGRPTFNLGWVRGKERTSAAALSAGEAALFLSLLTLALLRRSEGRRILLVEADPLDEQNREGLLRALAPHGGELDALVVATSARWEEGHYHDGFNLIQLMDRPEEVTTHAQAR